MQAQGNGRRNRLFSRATGFIPIQCILLWCGFYFVLILIALAEVHLLRYAGVSYVPGDSLSRARVGTISVSDDGRWAASQISFQGGTFRSEFIDDIVLHDLQNQTARRLHLNDIKPHIVVISPTAELLAIGCQDSSVYVTTRECDTVGRLLCDIPDKRIDRLTFSPNDRWLAVTGDQRTYVLRIPQLMLTTCGTDRCGVSTCEQRAGCVQIATSNLPRETVGHADSRSPVCIGAAASLAFTSDSGQVVTLDRRGKVSWWEAGSGQRIGTRSLTGNPVVRTALSPDGRFAAVVLCDGGVQCWDLVAGQRRWRHWESGRKWSDPWPSALAFSPNSRLLVTACRTNGEYAIHCCDVATGECLQAWPQYESSFKGLVVISGESIYSWDPTGVVKAWDIPTGRQQHQLLWVPESDG